MSAAFLPKRCETTFISSGCDTKSAIICVAPTGLFISLFGYPALPLWARLFRPYGAGSIKLETAPFHIACVCWASFLFPRALPIPLKHLIHLVVRQIFMEVIVNLHCRGPAASADAFDLFQRKSSVSGGLLVSDTQFALAMVQNLFAATQHA